MIKAKIDGERLVCTAEQSQKLIELGVERICTNCYEKSLPFYSEIGGEKKWSWDYAGEYMGQEDWLPAWTMEEMSVCIGSAWVKPDLLSVNEWTPQTDMMQFALHLPKKRLDFKSGAAAYAELLISLIEAKHLTASEVNERLSAYATGNFYNPVVGNIEKDIQKKAK